MLLFLKRLHLALQVAGRLQLASLSRFQQPLLFRQFPCTGIGR